MTTTLTTKIVRSLRRVCTGARALLAGGGWRSRLAGSPLRRELAVVAHRLREVADPRGVARLALTALALVAFAVLVTVDLSSLPDPVGLTDQPAVATNQLAAPPSVPPGLPDPVTAGRSQAPSARPPDPGGSDPLVRVNGTGLLVHQVGRGDTLTAIALRYGVPVEDIAAQNPTVRSLRLPVGHQMFIPAPNPDVLVIQPGIALSGYAVLFGLSTSQLMELNPQIVDPDLIYAGGRLNLTRQVTR